MMPSDPVRDIMRRTMANLEFVEAKATLEGPYETTQLINSFLGALAHPWEAMRPQLEEMTLTEAEGRGWPDIKKEREQDRDPANLGDLIRLMRNGLAHGNIDFFPGGDGRIAALRVWNALPNGARSWGAVVSTADLRAFLFAFAALIEEIHAEGGWQGRERA